MDENKKREGLGCGQRKAAFKTCMGDVQRAAGAPSDQPAGQELVLANQAAAIRKCRTKLRKITFGGTFPLLTVQS